METILDVVEQQANTEPTPAPASFPYDIPVRVDGARKLVELARAVQRGTPEDVQKAMDELLQSAS